MKVVPVGPAALRVGAAVPFALRDAQGTLLLAAGGVIESEAMRQQLVARGTFVDIVDSDNFKKALAGRLNAMVNENASMGRIAKVHAEIKQAATQPRQATTSPAASTQASLPTPPATAPGPGPGPGPAPVPAPAAAPTPTLPNPTRKPADPLAAWQSIALRAGALLHDPPPQDFVPRLQRLDQDLLDLLQSDTDAGLLVLVQQAVGEFHQYSAHHGLLVSVVCELAARELPDWPDDCRAPLRCAALTMNIAMTALQDQLALQEGALSVRQRAQVQAHAQAGASQLAALGVTDPLWLAAVAHHHSAAGGPLSALPVDQRLGRLIQRADIFAARLSPRKLRPALSATAAAKAAYLDERQQPDEAGAAIIKATGLYPPGSYVQLASTELAVVLRRGARPNEPRVASIIGRSGTPLGEPAVRDTRLPTYEIKASVPPKDVRVRLSLARLIQLAG